MQIWLYLIAGILALLVVFLVFMALYLKKCRREVTEENLKAAELSAGEILEKIGWESKQRWLNENEIEFVSLIIGIIPHRHKVWARVRISKKELAVTLEYYYDADATERRFAEMVADSFRKRGVAVTTKQALRQPYPEEIRVVPEAPPTEE